ncbi:MAG: RNA methyltransferase [Firmicutes bacterium]|nr:RNA methyltransferase [Bacillota bacterium]
MIITSSANPTFKNLKLLTTKKGRREFSLCIIEGEKIIFENLERIEQIFVCDGYVITPNLRDMEPIVLDKKLFDSVSSLETPTGIIAIAGIPNQAEVTYPFLVLDRIQDPGNMGTLLRTACAFGFKTIFTVDCVDVWSQKVLRAGMGSQFKLNIIDTNYEMLTKHIGDCELFIADMGGQMASGDYLDEKDFGLVLGNEGQGVSVEIKKLPHTIVSIPMQNNVESLNVAVAGGILMYELVKVK